MKIRQAEQRVNASYNTIKKNIEDNPEYHKKIDNVLHVTKSGLKMLEKKYGISGEVLSDDNIYFYKNQIIFLKSQLEETKQYNQLFLKQLESRNYEAESNKEKIKKLEEDLNKKELEKLELKHKLDLEKNKSIWQKIFGRKK